MRRSLGRVLRAVDSAQPDGEWLAARGRVADERARVDEYLARSDIGPVYGFTTRLGHEDSTPLSADGQQELLDGHLVGPSVTVPADWRRLLVASKIEQCSHGESGIHPSVYQSLLESLATHDPIRGNWLNSYSSGDVVAGAWLVNDLRERSLQGLEHPGDLITLINGDFVSTAMAIVATGSLIEAVVPLLSAWLPTASPTDQTPSSRPVTQLPISLRDATPVMSAVRVAIDSIGAAIENRLGAPSCNPRFAATPGGVFAQSQSSFLDFGLTFAMSSGMQLANLVAGLWQRLIQHRCSDDFVPKRIQSPKSAQGLVERIRAGAHFSNAFSGFDSEGIEDLRDLSAIHAHTLLAQCCLIREFEAIWAGLGTSPGMDPSAIRDELVGTLVHAAPCRSGDESAAMVRIAGLAPTLR